MNVRSLFACGAIALTGFSAAAAQKAYVDYVQLDYLEAQGDLYVDTGIPAKTNVAIEAEIACTPKTSATGENHNAMGALYGSAAGYICIGSYGNTGVLNAYFAVTTRVGTGASIPYDTEFHHYYVGQGRQSIDNVTAYTVAEKEMTHPNGSCNIYVFGMGFNSHWGQTYVAKNKVRYFKVYQGGELKRDLIPVLRLRDYVPCFYDKKNDNYREKQGDGEFVFPKVKDAKYLNGDYLQLDYIYSKSAANGKPFPTADDKAFSSSVTNYVDTGCMPTNVNFGFYLDFKYDGLHFVATSTTPVNEYPRIMGSGCYDNGNWNGIVLLGATQSRSTVGWYNGRFYAFGSPAQATCVAPQCRRVVEMKNRKTKTAAGEIKDLTAYASTNGVNGSIWLGNVNAPDWNCKTGTPIRIYRFKVYDGDETVHDFVPVLSHDYKVGLLDIKGDKGFREASGFFPGAPYPAADGKSCVRLEYLESDGYKNGSVWTGAYLDFGIPAVRKTALDVTMAITASATTLEDYMGTTYGGSTGWIAVGDYGEGNLASYCATGEGMRKTGGVEIPFDNEFHHYYCGNGKQSIDAESNTTTCANEMPGTLNVTAFGAMHEYGDTEVYRGKMKIKKMKIYFDGELVRDLIPVKVGDRACMYDRVGEQYYFNQGDRSFIEGPAAVGGLIIVFR